MATAKGRTRRKSNPKSLEELVAQGALGLALAEAQHYIELQTDDLTMRRFMDRQPGWGKDRARDHIARLERDGKVKYTGQALERDRGGMLRAVKVWRLPNAAKK